MLGPMANADTQTKRLKRAPRILATIIITAIALMLPITTAFATGTNNKNSPFTDVAINSSSYKAIMWCVQNKIITGYGDGTFRPDNTVSEKSFYIMLSRAFEEFNNLNHPTPKGEPIQRYDAAQAISAITNQKGTSADTYDKMAAAKEIAGYDDIPSAYQDAVSNVYALNIMRGSADKSFNGAGAITRGQAAVIIYRTANLTDELALAVTPRLSNGKDINQDNVVELIGQLKKEFPSNKDFPGYAKLKNKKSAENNSIRNIIESYVVTGTEDDKCSTDTGCGGWAAYVEDYIFGQNAKFKKTTLEKIHPGDLMLKLDSANKLTHVQIFISPVKGFKLDQSVRITNANNGLGVPTAAGTTAYKINWTNSNSNGARFDVYTAYPD